MMYGLLAALAGAAVAISMLHDAAPSAATTPLPGAQPADAPAPQPVQERVVLYNETLTYGAPPGEGRSRHVLVLREGDRDFSARLDFERIGDNPAVARPQLALVAPDNRTVARCDAGDCTWTVPSPAPGFWRIDMTPQGEYRATIVASVLRTRTSPSPAETLFDEERRRSVTRAETGWTDAFVVQEGGPQLVFGLGYGGRSSASAPLVTIIDPTGETAGSFSSGSFTIADAQPGLWRARCAWGGAEYMRLSVEAHAAPR